jgi:hypothetical protein
MQDDPPFLEGVLMRLQFRTWSCPILALGLILSVGCGPTNEETLGGQTSKAVPQKEGMPNFKSYGEYAQWQAKEDAKNKAAGKGKSAPKAEAPKPAAKAPSGSQK